MDAHPPHPPHSHRSADDPTDYRQAERLAQRLLAEARTAGGRGHRAVTLWMAGALRASPDRLAHGALRSFMFHPECAFDRIDGADGARVVTRPAIVAAHEDSAGKVRGAWRQFLPTNWDTESITPELCVEAMAGRSPWLGGRVDSCVGVGPQSSPVWVIVRSVEDAVSVAAASGWRALCPHRGDFRGVRAIEEMVLAADAAREGAGPVALVWLDEHERVTAGTAAEAVEQWKVPGVVALWAAPSPAVVRAAIEHVAGHGKADAGRRLSEDLAAWDAMGWPEGLDWRSVGWHFGAEVVARAVTAGVDVARLRELQKADRGARHAEGARGTRAMDDLGGGRGDGGKPWLVGSAGDDSLVIEEAPLVRARRYLWEERRLPSGSRFTLARWGGEWWVYESGRYAKLPDETLRSVAIDWLNQFQTIRRGKVEPLNPTTRAAEEMVKCLAVDTAVVGERMPMWLPPVIGERGPAWGSASALERFRVRERDDGRAHQRVVFLNGALDLDEVAREGRVELHPHTPDYFGATCLPFALPVEEFRAMVCGDDPAPLYERLCPKWYGWLADACDQDPAWERQLQLMLGDTISGDRTLEKVFLVIGEKRSGKGIIEDALGAVLGEENVASTNFPQLSDRFGLAILLGKIAAVMPDAHLEDFKAGKGAMEMLKAISGQGRVQVRDLYQPARTVKLSARFWIFCNEKPDLRDDSGAMTGRLVVLPMTQGREGREDYSIKSSVPREAPGIMLFALMGALELARMQRREIPMSIVGKQVHDEYGEVSAHVRTYVAVCLQRVQEAEDGGEYVGETLDDLYRSYCHWREEDQGATPLSFRNFAEKLHWALGMVKWHQPRADDGTRKRRAPGWQIKPHWRGKQTTYAGGAAPSGLADSGVPV